MSAIEGWHAHIYYDPDSKAQAAALRETLGQRFAVMLGRMHDVPVGPHPQAMFQIAFGPAEFPTVVPWLTLNRQGLTVLVHPETGNALADHRDHAMWMGAVLPLKLDVLSQGH